MGDLPVSESDSSYDLLRFVRIWYRPDQMLAEERDYSHDTYKVLPIFVQSQGLVRMCDMFTKAMIREFKQRLRFLRMGYLLRKPN